MQEYACVYNLHVHENNYNYHKCYNIEGLNATHNFFACIDIYAWINLNESITFLYLRQDEPDWLNQLVSVGRVIYYRGSNPLTSRGFLPRPDHVDLSV